MDHECLVIYNNIYKKVILNSSIQFGIIHEKILELFNLIIYNIEYCNIKINNKEYIIGKDNCLFNNHLSDLLLGIDNIEIQFNIFDRKRDENGYVIKENEIIDNYYKWYQEYENNNYRNYINQHENVMFNQYETNQIQNNTFFNNLLSNITSSLQDQINNLENNQINTEVNVSTIDSSIDLETEINEIIEVNEENKETEENELNIDCSIEDNYLDIQSNNDLHVEDSDEDQQPNNQDTININNINYNNLDLNTSDDYLEVNTLTNEYINIIRNTISDTFDTFQNHNDLNINNNNFDENIIIALTKEDFDELEIIGEDENIQDEKCNICLTELDKDNKIIKLKCGHFFDYECIENWLRKHSNKCPTCRIEIAKGEPINL